MSISIKNYFAKALKTPLEDASHNEICNSCSAYKQ